MEGSAVSRLIGSSPSFSLHAAPGNGGTPDAPASLEEAQDSALGLAGWIGENWTSWLAAGLRILLIERRLIYGGGLATVEATLPGFYHNSHSINHFHISETPWFRDLGLADKVA